MNKPPHIDNGYIMIECEKSMANIDEECNKKNKRH